PLRPRQPWQAASRTCGGLVRRGRNRTTIGRHAFLLIIRIREALTARGGGQSAINFRGDGLGHKADTAVAESEVAAAGVQAAKTADEVLAAAAVAVPIRPIHGGRGGPAVHGLMPRVGVQ